MVQASPGGISEVAQGNGGAEIMRYGVDTYIRKVSKDLMQEALTDASELLGENQFADDLIMIATTLYMTRLDILIKNEGDPEQPNFNKWDYLWHCRLYESEKASKKQSDSGTPCGHH